MLSAPAAMLALMLVPVHGVVLDARADGSSAIVRTEPASKTIAAGTRDYRLVPATHLPRGTGVDGYVDASTRPWTLREPTIAAPFAPGTPDTASVVGTNRVDMSAVHDPRTGNFIITSAEDNLVKGTSGQAVQIMNLWEGWEETAGLV